LVPLKVTAELAGPVGGDPPALDGLLERLAFLDVFGGTLPPPGDPRWTAHPPGTVAVPFGRRPVEGFPWPVPLCSSPVFAARTDGVQHFSRRFAVDPGLLRADARTVHHTNMGEFKSYRMPLRVRDVGRVVWFCFGDPIALRDALSDVTHLGKKTSAGHGPVASWRIEPIAADLSWFAPSPVGDVLMRSLPAAALAGRAVVGWRPGYGGVVPPYWLRTGFGEAVVPC
jgi:hypothetical protein